MSGGVFICYRREESAFAARVIYDRVAQKVGRENVFLDVDNIDPGVDWLDALNERLVACDGLIGGVQPPPQRTTARRRDFISLPPTKETLLARLISDTPRTYSRYRPVFGQNRATGSETASRRSAEIMASSVLCLSLLCRSLLCLSLALQP
jgi:hypothetical protein